MLTPRQTIAALRALAKNLGTTPGARQLRASDAGLALAALSHFKSTAAAIRAAGLPRRVRVPPLWSRERVLMELKKIHRRGVPIKASTLRQEGRHDLVLAADRHFGTMVRARDAAGISPPKRTVRRRGWDPESLKAEIGRRHAEGEPLAHTKAPRGLTSAGCYFFGSWRAAVEEAGLRYDDVRLLPSRTRHALIAALKRVAKENPVLSATEFWRPPHSALRKALVRRFGSVEEAARHARLRDWPKRRRQRMYSRQELLKAIRQRVTDGKSLRERAIVAEAHRLHDGARRWFGSWREAARAAGVEHLLGTKRAASRSH